MPRCCCNRILTTSNGVTMTRASVIPAAKPAPIRRTSDSFPSCMHLSIVNRPDPDTSGVHIQGWPRSKLTLNSKWQNGRWEYCMVLALHASPPLSITFSSRAVGFHLVSQQALVEGVCAHAQGILEGEVCCKGSEPFPQRLSALLLHNLLPAVNNTCSRSSPSDFAPHFSILGGPTAHTSW